MNCNESINAERWKQLETKTKDWEGLGKIGNIFESTDLQKGAEGLYFHEKSYITLSSKRSIQHFWKRKEEENDEKSPTIPEQQDLQEKECQTISPKRLRFSIGGPVYHKNKWVWCIKGSDKKDPAPKTGKLMLISTLTEWREFKIHTVNIKDKLLRLQLSKLVQAISALLDPLAADLMYHFHVDDIM